MAAQDQKTSPLSVLGLDASEEALYRALVQAPRLTLEEAAAATGADPRSTDELVDRLVGLRLVLREADHLVAAPPEQAIDRLIDEERRRLQAVGEQLAGLRRVVPVLAADYRSARGAGGGDVQVEALSFEEGVLVLRNLGRESEGDLLWMRASTWNLPVSGPIEEWVADQLRQGRRSRVLYPARVLEEAPASVRARADLGEQVRILGQLPGSMALIGERAALVPSWQDPRNGPVLVVRDPSLVTALHLLFAALWERALIVPGVGADEEEQRASARRLILDQMARGAKDEQIARTLDLSLRTVRRRVADLMEELGVDSRFQAGVEAVRRGWL